MIKSKKIVVSLCIIIGIIVLAVGIYLWYTVKKENEKSLNNPEGVIGTYIEYINTGNYKDIYGLLSSDSKAKISEEDFVAEYEKTYGKLEISSVESSDIKTEKINNNSSKVTYNTKINTIYGDFNFENSVTLKKQEDKKYYLDWNYGVIYPGLEKTDKIDVKKEYAKRGSLIDRNGVLLGGSGYIASVGLVPGWMNEQTKSKDIQKVADLLGTTAENINKKMSASYVKSDTFVELATMSKENLSTISSLRQIEGVKIKDISSRVYPQSEKAAHITGYVQKANKDDINNNKEYDENSLVGRTGLEKVFEDRLRGENGYKISIVKENGDNKKTIINKEKRDGENIKLTIDSELQEQVYNLYANDNSATVVMNPKTGEILALVSTPSYNPNDFVIGMSTQKWNELSNNSNNPLYARFLRSYAPGSSFKAIIGAIALTTGTITSNDVYDASGTSWQKDDSWGSYYITTLKQYSEPANLLNALIYSDNIFFAKTAIKIGINALEEQLKNIGFEANMNFELGISKSQISNNGKFASEVQLADSGYGQGQILINPVHYASMYSAFVNDGNMIMPYLEITENKQTTYFKENAFSKETVEEIKKDLIQTIENPNGTAHSAQIQGLTLAGKTGTAETKSEKGEDAKEIGWFNCFVADPNSQNQLLVVSMVEGVENNGGSGYVVNKVKKIFENYK